MTTVIKGEQRGPWLSAEAKSTKGNHLSTNDTAESDELHGLAKAPELPNTAPERSSCPRDHI